MLCTVVVTEPLAVKNNNIFVKLVRGDIKQVTLNCDGNGESRPMLVEQRELKLAKIVPTEIILKANLSRKLGKFI